MSQIYVCILNGMMLPCLMLLMAHTNTLYMPRCGNWLESPSLFALSSNTLCYFIIQSVDALLYFFFSVRFRDRGLDTHIWMHTQKRAFCFRSLAALYNRYHCLIRTALFFLLVRAHLVFFCSFIKSILMCPFSIEITFGILCENFSIFIYQKFQETNIKNNIKMKK